MKSEIRNLKRRLGNAEKKRANLEANASEVEDTEIEKELEPTKMKCPKCTDGWMDVVSLGVRTLSTCAVCGNRVFAKSNGNR